MLTIQPGVEKQAQPYYAKLVIPWAAKLNANPQLTNGSDVLSREVPEALQYAFDTAEELRDKLLGPFAFAAKLFFGHPKVAGDPSFLTYVKPTDILTQQFYPHVAVQLSFERPYGMPTAILLPFEVPFSELVTLVKSVGVSVYVGGAAGVELLIENFRP